MKTAVLKDSFIDRLANANSRVKLLEKDLNLAKELLNGLVMTYCEENELDSEKTIFYLDKKIAEQSE